MLIGTNLIKVSVDPYTPCRMKNKLSCNPLLSQEMDVATHPSPIHYMYLDIMHAALRSFPS